MRCAKSKPQKIDIPARIVESGVVRDLSRSVSLKVELRTERKREAG
jgi:hypothetical protein